MSTEQRTSVENAIWLCQTCAKLVDNDDERFTPDVLRSWKAAAEVCAADVVGTPDPSEAAREARSKLRATFEPALIELESAKVDTHYILSKQRASHDQALGIYRRHVPEDLRDSYEKAIGTFQSVRQNVQPAMISFLQQQVGERPSGSTREEVMASIEAILAFAS